ncbi:MAG: ABC transporter permease subunit [Candidatus Atribacteria bacterium]|nr:ABC transporter permease subunit [Candidatus Atribacteria bacterium]
MNTFPTELKKVKANFRTYVGMVVLWALGIMIGVNVWFNPSLVPLKNLGFRLSGLYIPGLTLYPLAIVGPAVAVLIAGESIAGERIKGTLRMILSRPVSRFQVYTGKMYLTILYSFFIVFSTLILTSILGIILFGSGSVILPVKWENMSAGFFTLTAPEAVWRMILAGTTVSIYILAFASIAMCLSSFMNHSLASPIFTLVLTAALSVLQNLEVFKPVSPYLITSHFLDWQTFLSRSIDWNQYLVGFLVVMVYLLSGFIIGAFTFIRRDETG